MYEEAGYGKNFVCWFYGFKLHLIINTAGEVLSAEITAANRNDHSCVEKLTRDVFGKLYGDKGYISESLKTQGVFLVSKFRKNMPTQEFTDFDALMLKKRMCLESVIEQLKHQSNLSILATEVSQLPSQCVLRLDCLYVSGKETVSKSISA